MTLLKIKGVCDRRILLNYRLDAAVAETLLPAPFRPQLVEGYAIAGICLIRLKAMRPPLFPAFTGFTSENAALRIAVEWDRNGKTERGVYVTQRATASRFNRMVGSRFFPIRFQQAVFTVDESADRYRIAIQSPNRSLNLSLEASVADTLPEASVFKDMTMVSDFFQQAPLAYSPGARPGEYDGVHFHTQNWNLTPMTVHHLAFAFADDLPEGSIQFDNALLMTQIDHEWLASERLCCA